MNKFLNKFNGYKTIIGMILAMVLVAFCKLTGTDIPGIEMPDNWIDVVKFIIGGGAAVFAGVGTVDKVAKARTEEIKQQLLKTDPLLKAGEEFFNKKR